VLRCLRANACRGMDYMMMMLPRGTPLTELSLSGAAGAPLLTLTLYPNTYPNPIAVSGERLEGQVQAARRVRRTFR